MPQKKAAKKTKKKAVGKKAATRKNAVKKKSVRKKAVKQETASGSLRTARRPIPRIDLRSFINELNKRAYEIFQQRGASHGSDWDDWFRAEKELKKKYGIEE